MKGNPSFEGQIGTDIDNAEKSLLSIDVNEEKEPLLGYAYLGFVGNLSFNFVFQEIAYFNSVFGDSFGTLTNMMYCVANNISLILMIWFGDRLSLRLRIVAGAICLGVVIVAIPLVAMNDIKFQIWAGLALIAAMGFANSIFTSATYALTGMCSARARNAQNIGASLPSILAWPLMVILNKVFTWAVPGLENRITGAVTFTLLLLGALAVFGVVPYYLWNFKQTSEKVSLPDKVDSTRRSMAEILVDTLPLALALWGVSFLTFIVIPDQVLQWESNYANLYPGGILGVQDVNIYIFQCCDTLGRLVVSVYPNLLGRAGIVSATVSRLCILPLFFIATAQWYLFSCDLVRIAVNALWGVSYGILVSLAFIHGPSQVSSAEGHVAGPTMSFAFENGIFMGSCIALVIQFGSTKWNTNRIFHNECVIDQSFQLLCRATESL